MFKVKYMTATFGDNENEDVRNDPDQPDGARNPFVGSLGVDEQPHLDANKYPIPNFSGDGMPPPGKTGENDQNRQNRPEFKRPRARNKKNADEKRLFQPRVIYKDRRDMQKP